MTEFDSFWTAYPRKVAKLAAMKAFHRARTVATFDEITAGVEAYKQHPPSDPQYIAHPASWLNAGRWMDEYDEPAPKAERYTWTCPHEPECPNALWCDVMKKRTA